MALADPQSVNATGTAASLPRTSSGVNTGEFTSQDGNLKLTVTHKYGKRTRREVRIALQKIAPDPLISSTNIIYGTSVYLVVDAPKTGFSVTELQKAVEGLATWLTAASSANAIKVLGGES